MLDARALLIERGGSLRKALAEAVHVRALVGASCWAALILVSHLWGASLLVRPEPDMDLDAPPLFGRLHLDVPIAILFPVAVAAAIVFFGPRVVPRLRWRALVLSAFAGAAVWAVSLAASRGWDALAQPLRHPTGYLAALPLESPARFVDGFVDGIERLPLHVQSHPPGPVLFLWLLGAAGLRGPGPAAAAVILAGAASVPAVLLAVRDVAGETRARACVPFLVLAPAALWIATSMDALFVGVAAWGVALMILSTARHNRAGDCFALGGGALFGIALHLSYGLAPLSVVVLAVAGVRRRIRPLLVGVGAAIVVFAAFVLAGFWWFEGLVAAAERYRAGISSVRPGAYFAVANLAAFAVALGPAVAGALAGRWDRRLAVLIVPALIVVVLADASGLSKGEVERVWLPFAPWLTLASGMISGSGTEWLATQAVWTIMVQVAVQTPW
jgi:methylthioxylose transferase